jgi:aspartate/glutamate racemase
MSAAVARPTKPDTLGRRAVDRLIKGELVTDRNFAEALLEVILDEIEDPDSDMVAAGVAELALALPPKTNKAYQRQLCRVIWRAMLARVGE